MRTFLRWAGSKKQLLPILERYWSNEFSRYIEPFAGSSCLFFHLEPNAALLADINSELVVALRAIRLDVYRVIECLRRLPRSKTDYYRVRSIKPSTLGTFEAAARFLYLNSLCFNGLYRTNIAGDFNVPYHPPGHKTVPEELLIEAAKRLRSATILNGDFESTVESAGRGDFVYLDPPFAVSRRRVFSEYGPRLFDDKDLLRLGSCLERMNMRGAKFVVSYADCREARQLLSPWCTRRVRTRRNIAGFTGDRRVSYELLASNITIMEPTNA